MACVANFSKSKPEIFPFGSIRFPMALFILLPSVLGSRAPFPSVQRWNSHVIHVGQLGLCFSRCLGKQKSNADLRETGDALLWPLLPFQGFAEGNADMAKVFCLFPPLGKFPSPVFSYDELEIDIWTAETFMDKCGYSYILFLILLFSFNNTFFLLTSGKCRLELLKSWIKKKLWLFPFILQDSQE